MDLGTATKDHEYKGDTTIDSSFITPRLRNILSGLEEKDFTKLTDEQILDHIDEYRKNNDFTVDDVCHCFPTLVFEEMNKPTRNNDDRYNLSIMSSLLGLHPDRKDSIKKVWIVRNVAKGVHSVRNLQRHGHYSIYPWRLASGIHGRSQRVGSHS